MYIAFVLSNIKLYEQGASSKLLFPNFQLYFEFYRIGVQTLHEAVNQIEYIVNLDNLSMNPYMGKVTDPTPRARLGF